MSRKSTLVVGMDSTSHYRSDLKGLLGAILALLAAAPVLMAQEANLPAGVVEQESGYYYTVQKGDTLWDLSSRFADSPFYWPSMWQKNPQIPNPHRIFPGDRIRLYRKSWTDLSARPEAPSAPGSPAKSAPQPPYYHYPGMNSVGFIRNQAITPSATIFKLPSPKTLSGQFDTLLIHPAADTVLLAGQRYTVYRIWDPLQEGLKKAFTGYQHLILGIVEITEVTPDLATAAVLTSFREMQAGDKLTPFENRPSQIPLVPSTEGIQGQILCAEEHQAMVGDHDLVFIDRGHQDGIRDGQQYLIYDSAELYTSPQSGIAARLPPTDQGTLLVLRTEAQTATALVTNAKQDIAPGALITSPKSP